MKVPDPPAVFVPHSPSRCTAGQSAAGTWAGLRDTGFDVGPPPPSSCGCRCRACRRSHSDLLADLQPRHVTLDELRRAEVERAKRDAARAAILRALVDPAEDDR